jgi:hypothetical protein
MKEITPPEAALAFLIDEKTCRLPLFVYSAVADSDFRVNMCRVQIEKVSDRFAIRVDSLLSAILDSFARSRAYCYQAIHGMYVHESHVDFMLISRPVPRPIRPLSAYNRIVMKGLLSHYRDFPSLHILTGLTEIARSCPFAFPQLDPVSEFRNLCWNRTPNSGSLSRIMRIFLIAL